MTIWMNHKMSTMKDTTCTALSGMGWGLHGGDVGGNLTHAQYKHIWNWHNESPCTVNIC
jgi:hypothetical protein